MEEHINWICWYCLLTAAESFPPDEKAEEYWSDTENVSVEKQTEFLDGENVVSECILDMLDAEGIDVVARAEEYAEERDLEPRWEEYLNQYAGY